MKLSVEIKKTETQLIEVAFPIYIKGGDIFDSGGWYEAYYRINADGVQYRIQINESDEWEFRKSNISLARDLGYMLVERRLDFEVIQADIFYSKIDEMRKAIAEVPAK